MRDPVRSVYAFGIYVIVLGLVLMIIPNAYLAVGGLPPTHEVWIRVVDMFVFLPGYYYITAAPRRDTALPCPVSFILHDPGGMVSFTRWVNP